MTSLAEEAARLVEVLQSKVASPHQLVGDLPLQLLEQLQHLVVGMPREHYLPRVELVHSRPEAPEVEVEVVLEAENDLRRAVKPRHEVGCDVRAEIRGIQIDMTLYTVSLW